MNLDLDIGNSRIKWRVLSVSGEVQSRGSCFDLEELEVAAAIDRVRVSSVAGQDIRAKLENWALERFQADAEFAISCAEMGGVKNGYVHPHRLGVDRWMAVLAGYERIKDHICVIDCGSALTMDFVEANGLHLGGTISPGISMMRDVLVNRTRGIELDGANGHDVYENSHDVYKNGHDVYKTGHDVYKNDSELFGTETTSAVAIGVLNMALGLIAFSLDQYESRKRVSVTAIITGGDAEIVSARMNRELQLVPDLVLEGINLALP